MIVWHKYWAVEKLVKMLGFGFSKSEHLKASHSFPPMKGTCVWWHGSHSGQLSVRLQDSTWVQQPWALPELSRVISTERKAMQIASVILIFFSEGNYSITWVLTVVTGPWLYRSSISFRLLLSDPRQPAPSLLCWWYIWSIVSIQQVLQAESHT